MKIGTKANAIDDLGKFDVSKMTIKVNGKQIYPQKRYAIVRVEHYCPIIEDNNGDLKEAPYCPQDKDRNFWCSDCKMLKNYGDTKEQLVAKIITILRREKKGWFHISEREIATKIIEFLGVE